LFRFPLERSFLSSAKTDLKNVAPVPTGFSLVLGLAAINVSGDACVDNAIAQLKVVFVNGSAGCHVVRPLQ